MAYADTSAILTGNKLRAGAVVLVLEVGVAWALIAGLTMVIDPRSELRLRTTTVPLPDITPKPVPPKADKKDVVRLDPKPLRDPVIDLGPAVLPTFAADDGKGLAEVVFPEITPLPLPDPKPSFAPRLARAKGKTGDWVTTKDYPTSALRQELAGTTRYRLAIGADGKVSGCTITISSGHPELDQTTCDKLSRRAQFEPATGEDGARVAGSFSGAVTWQLPPD